MGEMVEGGEGWVERIGKMEKRRWKGRWKGGRSRVKREGWGGGGGIHCNCSMEFIHRLLMIE